MIETNQKRNKLEEDRISNLPDDILHKILSFVSIRIAVQSCVLSKRWRYLWTSLPNLNFDSHEFGIPCVNCPYASVAMNSDSPESELSCLNCKHIAPRNQHQKNCFLNFVNMVLSLRDNSSVCEFRFSSSDSTYSRLFDVCICYAVSHNVKKLHVSLLNRWSMISEFPSCLFGCKSLTVLELYYYKKMLLPKSFSLPSVKTLHLECFPFNDGDGVNREFFTNFPSLETLILVDGQLTNANVSAPQLKNLEIIFQQYDYGRVRVYNREELVLSTPKLTSFTFKGKFSLVVSMEDLPILDKVHLDLFPFYSEFDFKEVQLNLIKMLEHLRNAKSMVLSHYTIGVLELYPDTLACRPPPFCKLKHLKLIASRRQYYSTLPHPNVMTYLTKGSTCDAVEVDFPEGRGGGNSQLATSRFEGFSGELSRAPSPYGLLPLGQAPSPLGLVPFGQSRSPVGGVHLQQSFSQSWTPLGGVHHVQETLQLGVVPFGRTPAPPGGARLVLPPLQLQSVLFGPPGGVPFGPFGDLQHVHPAPPFRGIPFFGQSRLPLGGVRFVQAPPTQEEFRDGRW